MKRILAAVLLVALIIGGWYAYKEYHRKAVDLTSVDATVQTVAASMINAFETDPVAATRMYVDKVIAVEGTVKDIDAEGYPVVIFLGNAGSMSSVKCSMDSVHADGYKAIPKGSVVMIKGACTGYQSEELLGTDVELTRCVIQNK